MSFYQVTRVEGEIFTIDVWFDHELDEQGNLQDSPAGFSTMVYMTVSPPITDASEAFESYLGDTPDFTLEVATPNVALFTQSPSLFSTKELAEYYRAWIPRFVQVLDSIEQGKFFTR